MAESIITQERLKEILHYDPETGVFTWLVRTARCVRVGAIASGMDTKGYGRIMIKRKAYKAHRLAWLYVYGEMPKGFLDHIDRNPANNRISNLRETTHAHNLQNQDRCYKGNKLGILGVSYVKADRVYVAHIKLDGLQRQLGRFQTAELAKEAYLKAKMELHPTFKP